MQVPPPPGLPPGRSFATASALPASLPAPLPSGAPPGLPGIPGASLAVPDISSGTTLEPQSPEEAAKAFASILFGYMFAEMRSKEEDSLLGGGDTEMFMDFFDQAIARSFVDQGNPLVDELMGRLLPKDPAAGDAGRS
ncbi:MAG: hypothetical protein VKO21_03995 [Candidatus Sericytochromatia bacterium]|nr:hypothetical protein [Candidatus Sericytochromatia bacterium]